jgi:hypothetical protein
MCPFFRATPAEVVTWVDREFTRSTRDQKAREPLKAAHPARNALCELQSDLDLAAGFQFFS